jgi:hypothetical protein
VRYRTALDRECRYSCKPHQQGRHVCRALETTRILTIAVTGLVMIAESLQGWLVVRVLVFASLIRTLRPVPPSRIRAIPYSATGS